MHTYAFYNDNQWPFGMALCSKNCISVHPSLWRYVPSICIAETAALTCVMYEAPLESLSHSLIGCKFISCGDATINRWLSGWVDSVPPSAWICTSQVQIPAGNFSDANSLELFTHNYSGQLSQSSFRGRQFSNSKVLSHIAQFILL